VDRFGPVAIVAGAVLGALVLGFGFIVLNDRRSAPPIIIEDPRPHATIVVAVDGAVATPGVYGLPGGARVQDALRVAGGTTRDADLALVNPAARLRDEDRLVVPTRRPAVGAHTPGDGSPTEAAAAAGKININTASAAELDTLPRIGPVLAQRIIDDRERNGPFRSVDELARVTGISPAMVEDLRPYLTV
jgi:competence protein ComEA